MINSLLGFSYGNILTIILASIAFVLVFWRKLLERHKYPPGPLPLPLIGNDYSLFTRARNNYRFAHWRKYGTVVSHVARGRWAVHLFGYDAIHEAFVVNGEFCSNRITGLQNSGFPAEGFLSNDRWKELRKQAMTVLRDHGMGRLQMEEKISDEFEQTLKLLADMTGTNTSDDLITHFGLAISNVLNQVIFGHRLNYHDHRFIALTRLNRYFEKALFATFIGFYKYLPWDPLKLEDCKKEFKHATEFITDEIKQHKANLDIDHPKDYIDSFLVEGIKNGDPWFTNDEQLHTVVIQLILAGYDTTATTLTWAVLFLINYPSTQEKMMKEINEFLGARAVKAADKDTMHYTHAFIHEVLRLGAVTGASVPHVCTEEIVVQGFKIPKGTIVTANMVSIYHDDKLHPDPYAFKPERFLDEQGKFVKPSGKEWLPFCIGKRACPGEPLARMEVFMIIVAFVQKFEVRRLTKEKCSENGTDSFTHFPDAFKFDLQLR